MIDLHTHTTESDGTCSPAELVDHAVSMGLEALAITDHDTLSGYDMAVPLAEANGLDLICGIELSTRWNGHSVHLLGYFLDTKPPGEFRSWLLAMQESRRERDLRMIARLRSLDIDITLEEVQAKGGNLPSRTHFARVMLAKRCVLTLQQAFDEYLNVGSGSAKAHFQRFEPSLADGISRISGAGGLPSIAHPVRITRDAAVLKDLIAEARAQGLRAIEVYHSDHGIEESNLYMSLAREHGLGITGGSDYHGETKSPIRLGTGLECNLEIPVCVLKALRGLKNPL